jgi:hypothetical protein
MKRKLINIISAKYLADYRILAEFNDGKKIELDFEPFLFTRSRGYYDKYRNLKYFKRFKIENGNLVWGKDWDLIFEIADLYDGKFASAPKKAA